MKVFLPLLVLVPLHSFAQFGRSYTGPTMQQNMQSRQYFNNSMNQRTQDFQQRQLQRSWSGMSSRPASQEARAQAQAKQQQLEQEATDKLALLTQQQQQRRQQHPAKNAQQAAAQLKADNKQLNLLVVKNYQEIFLLGQVAKALDAQQPSASVQRGLRSLHDNLMSDEWWRKQEGTPVAATIKAYGDSLTLFTTSLLGFDPAMPPATPAAFSVSSLNEQLAKDAFDQEAATRLIQEAGLTERLQATEQLPQAVKEFATMSTAAAADPALQSEPKKLRKEVQKSLRNVEKAMAQYSARLASADKVATAEKALRKSTSTYLAKNSK